MTKPVFENDAQCYDWHIDTACKWALEREKVRILKDAGMPKPWTKDEYLLNYRFCNVDRQQDRETKEINRILFDPQPDSPHLWFNAAVARYVNWSPSLEIIGWTDISKGYDPADLTERMRKVPADTKFFTGAYIIQGCTTPRKEGEDQFRLDCLDKRFYLANVVLKGISTIGAPDKGESLQSYHAKLMTVRGNGEFMAGQIIADLKYYTMRDAPDWETWAPIGPGPVEFLNRLHNRNVDKGCNRNTHYQELDEFFKMFKRRLPGIALELGYDNNVLESVRAAIRDAHNLGSNVPCEVNKYVRLMDGGQVRSKYDGSGNGKSKTKRVAKLAVAPSHDLFVFAK